MPRAYIRVDPNLRRSKRDYPDGAFRAFVEVLCAADSQPGRGTFESLALLKALLGPRARWIPYLVEHGDLIERAAGELYVDGWNHWQEGDLTVPERMARLRARKAPSVTPDVTTPVTPDVTTPVTPRVTSDVTAARQTEPVKSGGGGGGIDGGGAPYHGGANGSVDQRPPMTAEERVAAVEENRRIVADPGSAALAKRAAEATLVRMGVGLVADKPAAPTRAAPRPRPQPEQATSEGGGHARAENL